MFKTKQHIIYYIIEIKKEEWFSYQNCKQTIQPSLSSPSSLSLHQVFSLFSLYYKNKLHSFTSINRASRKIKRKLNKNKMRKPEVAAVAATHQVQKTKKGLWSPEEDSKLMQYMISNGQGCWSDVAKNAGLQRCGKSCRLRWINYLRPDLKRGAFSPHEEDLIIRFHSILGNRLTILQSFWLFYMLTVNKRQLMKEYCINFLLENQHFSGESIILKTL